MTGPKIGIVSPNILEEFYLNKDPLFIPIELKKMGVDTVIFAPGNKLGRRKDVPKVVVMDNYDYRRDSTLNPIRQFTYALQLNRLVRQEKPDALLFLLDSVAATIVKMLNPRIRIIFRNDIEEDSFDKMPYPKALIKLSFLIKSMVGSLLITQTKYNYDMTVAFAPFMKKKLRIIRFGIPDKFFLRKGEGKHRKKVILCVARIVRKKDQDILIRSFSKLYSKHQDWKVKFVGPVWDEQYFKEIKELVQKSGLSKKVKFLNFVSEKQLRKEYLDASIFCLPSSQENPSAVRCEAMGMGLPIVTAKTVGSEYVEGRGIVVPIGDENALTGALDKFMSSSKERDKASKKERLFAEQLRRSRIVKYMLSELGYTIK